MTDLPDPAEVAEALTRQQVLFLEFASDTAGAGVIDAKNRQTWGKELNDKVIVIQAARAYADSEEVWWCKNHGGQGIGGGLCWRGQLMLNQSEGAFDPECQLSYARLILEDTDERLA